VRTFRLVIFFVALCVYVAFFVVLLNVFAPNPTGRRYSSRTPLTTGQANSRQIGLDAEQVLADDLHLPRNDAPDQLQCICNDPANHSPNNCRLCIASVSMSGPYRRPDFVGTNFIAEAKNTQNLLYDSRDLPQIKDYAVAAKAMGRPLWVFIRVNTVLDPEFLTVVRETGGDVVPYFTVPNYIDPVDMTAKTGMRISLLAMGIVGLWEFGFLWRVARRSSPPKRPDDPVRQTADAVDRTEKFVKDAKDRHKS